MPADEEVSLDASGLQLRFAVCSEHAYDISWGAELDARPTGTGSLIGPA